MDNPQIIKKQVIDEQIAEFWKFCNEQMKDYERYEDDPVVPDYIRKFSALFLENLAKIIAAL